MMMFVWVRINHHDGEQKPIMNNVDWSIFYNR